jgi:predicted adenine nucleotide alpha hydrolase (AANH) superfamily ATPase
MSDKQERICIHACCAPCATVPVRRLKADSRVHVFYYNPNVYPGEEYMKRKEEIVRLARRWNFTVTAGEYDPDRWFERVQGLEDEPERGRRCEICIRMRLEKTAEFAREGGCEAFATTLTLSPRKDAVMINRIGFEISERMQIPYLESDFKKKDGFKESLIISKEEGLYRQDYCGCKYSRRRP